MYTAVGKGIMEVGKIMSSPAVTVEADSSVSLIASEMHEHGIGALPVVEGESVVGIVTDRDLVLALVAEPQFPPRLAARDIMTAGVISCFSDQSIEEAAYIMSDHQIRRLPVFDRAGALVGVISLGDIAENVSEQLAGETLGEIVETR